MIEMILKASLWIISELPRILGLFCIFGLLVAISIYTYAVLASY